MSFSRSIINGMHISALLNYLKNANDRLTLLLKDPLIKPHTIELVENIMELRNELNTQTIIQEDIAKRERDLKKMLIDLLDNDFENEFVKKLRLDLNDYVTPYFLVRYAEIKLNELEQKLDHKQPELLLHARTAKSLAIRAKKMRNSLDSIDPTTISWIEDIDVVYPDNQEKMVKNDIAQASAIFHGIDEYMHNLSKNKAGKIIKRRIRRTKRRNINSRNINNRKYRKYRNSTRRTQ